MDWKKLAEKFVKGFLSSSLSQKGMGITDSEAVRLRQMMREENYEGSMAFFICEKVYEVCEEFLAMVEALKRGEENLELIYTNVEKKSERCLYDFLKDRKAMMFCHQIHKLKQTYLIVSAS